ncbi:MAG: poly-beta-1,6-N-acetyl-D-glucosamine N-deacetylase PgaB [Thermodesulfobacteriota bacterium]
MSEKPWENSSHIRVVMSLKRIFLRIGFGSFLTILILISLSLSQDEREVKTPGELYDSAMEHFHRRKYPEAIEIFNRLIQSFPESKLIPYAHYMIGQSLLSMEHFEEAIKKFEFYLSHFPDGNRYREAELALQISRERLKIKEENLKKEISGETIFKTRRVKRRICAQLSYLDAKSFGDLEKRVIELKHLGVDTLIFKVFQNKGERPYRFANPQYEEGVYFHTAHAQVVDDLLGKVAEIVHRQGLDLFAWAPTRYATYGIEGHPEYRSKIYNFETRRMEVGRGLNLFHPDVNKRLKGFFRDLGRYPIDGILFQDDLILRHNEDFSPEANRAFIKEYGFLPHPDLFYIKPFKSESGRYYVKAYSEKFWIWAHWKNRWLMKLAKEWMEASRESNPKLQFALNLYFETILNPNNGLAWFSQTATQAIESGFDYYAIMTYHRQAMRGRNIGLKEALDLMAEVTRMAIQVVGDPFRVMAKIWILDWKTNESVSYDLAPLKEIEDLLTKILKEGEVSLTFVPYLHQFPLHLLKEKWYSLSVNGPLPNSFPNSERP